MKKESVTAPPRPFKARLKHYHRSASPALYLRKRKRWEDISPSKLIDASLSSQQGKIDLKIKLAPRTELAV